MGYCVYAVSNKVEDRRKSEISNSSISQRSLKISKSRTDSGSSEEGSVRKEEG